MMLSECGLYVVDERNNKATIDEWGSKEQAKQSLLSLVDCSDCYNCFRCYGCHGCYGCSDCSRCHGCHGCSRCYGCSGCSRCYDCSRCYNCFRCSRCYGRAEKTADLVVPAISNIHASIYAAASQPKALDMGDFHRCETTHCRAGWAIHLAGEAGYDLEKRFGSILAAMIIYDASDPAYRISPCDFFVSNEVALENMRQLANPAPS